MHVYRDVGDIIQKTTFQKKSVHGNRHVAKVFGTNVCFVSQSPENYPEEVNHDSEQKEREKDCSHGSHHAFDQHHLMWATADICFPSTHTKKSNKWRMQYLDMCI